MIKHIELKNKSRYNLLNFLLKLVCQMYAKNQKLPNIANQIFFQKLTGEAM